MHEQEPLQEPGHGQSFAEDLGNGIMLEMVAIPGGTFAMGSHEYTIEMPIHTVRLAPFCMGKYPVTQGQYAAVMGFNPSYYRMGTKRPVEQVSWDDAMTFCRQLSQRTGTPYRLPSEAEWEYACRAGTTTPFYFGESCRTELSDAAYRNNDENYIGSTAPGILYYGKPPKQLFREKTVDVDRAGVNPFGLYGMHGNVWEWCADQFYGSYTNKPDALKHNGAIAWTEHTTQQSPPADAFDLRILRGNSWSTDPDGPHSANRSWYTRDYGGFPFGFRLVCARPHARASIGCLNT